MSQSKKEIVNAVATANDTHEIEMLNIRPHVKKENYCFRVFECNLKNVMDSLRDKGLIKKKCLLVTSPRAQKSAEVKLPEDCYFTYVTDTKTDKLDKFVKECSTPEYTETAKVIWEEAQALVDYIFYKQEDPGTRFSGEDQLWQQVSELERIVAEKGKEDLDKYYLSKCIDTDQVETVIALGGGVAMDAGQYIATKLGEALGKELVFICVPTVLSVNAAFCYKAAMRRLDPQTGKYEVKYDSSLVQPDVLLMDPDIILTAGELNVVGSGDLLSCLTASFDWKLNSLVARNYSPKGQDVSKAFNQEVCDGALELIGLLAENIDNLNAMRAYAPILNEEHKNGKTHYEVLQQEANGEIAKQAGAGLRFLCMAYHWVAEQSWLMQHTMWESASEHGMFDYMEYLCGVEFKHGQIIGLCVYFMSLLQENEHERAVSMIKRLKLDITLNNLAVVAANNEKVTPEKLEECLRGVKAYLTGESYRYTIISAKDMSEKWIEDALAAYYKDFPCDYNGNPNKGVEKYVVS